MLTNLYYVETNGFAVAIILVMFFSVNRYGKAPSDQKIFDLLLISTIATILADTGMWLLNLKQFAGARELNLAVSYAYYAVQIFPSFLWLIYCYYLVNGNTKWIIKNLLLLLAPMIITLLLLFTNTKTGWIFRISDNNEYSRGNFCYFYLFAPFIYMGCSSFIPMRKSKFVDREQRKEYLYMALFPLPPAIGALLQLKYYGLSLIWVASVLSLLLIFINVQNSQISTDELTGTNNRRRLNRFLNWKINSLDKETKLFAIMLDLDDFKRINDTYGHAEGDKALIRVARVLQTVCNGTDCFLARFGGDEFTIVLEAKDNSAVTGLLKRIETDLIENNKRAKTQYTITLSYGCSEFGMDGINDLYSLLSAADSELYRQKRAKIKK